MRRGGAALVLACAGVALATPAPARAASDGLPPVLADGTLAPGGSLGDRLREPGDEVRLSNERTVTRWTNALRTAPARAQPRDSARTVTRLRLQGVANTAEMYGVLGARRDGRGRIWLHVRLPGRPNGRTAWAPESAFDTLHLSRDLLVVNRRTLRATYYRNGRRRFSTRVGVGKTGTPTPAGRFFIVRKAGAVYGPVYGPKVMFTNAASSLPDWPGGGMVGIHGTNQPSLVPGRPSHGCIRVRNAAVERLWRLVTPGTPLNIM